MLPRGREANECFNSGFGVQLGIFEVKFDRKGNSKLTLSLDVDADDAT